MQIALYYNRIHAGILHDAYNKSYLIDLDSSQGTFIGGTQLKKFTPTLITNKSFIRYFITTHSASPVALFEYH